MNLVIFTEEPSMKEALKHILPKLGFDGRNSRVIAFDGVGDLENALPNQLRALDPNRTRVLVLRDNDNGDCHRTKAKLVQMAHGAGMQYAAKVRIVCQMLEAWFIGDANALAASRHLAKPVPRRLKSCDPDAQQDPKRELRRLRPGYNAITGARAIAPHLSVSDNRSASFNITVRAIIELSAR